MLGKLLEFCSNRGYSDACPHILLHYIMAQSFPQIDQCWKDEAGESEDV